MVALIRTRYRRWPSGRIRDEYHTLFGLSIEDGWFSLGLIVAMLVAPFWPL